MAKDAAVAAKLEGADGDDTGSASGAEPELGEDAEDGTNGAVLAATEGEMEQTPEADPHAVEDLFEGATEEVLEGPHEVNVEALEPVDDLYEVYAQLLWAVMDCDDLSACSEQHSSGSKGDWTQRRGLFYKVLRTRDLENFVDETFFERATDERGTHTISPLGQPREFYRIEQGE